MTARARARARAATYALQRFDGDPKRARRLLERDAKKHAAQRKSRDDDAAAREQAAQLRLAEKATRRNKRFDAELNVKMRTSKHTRSDAALRLVGPPNRECIAPGFTNGLSQSKTFEGYINHERKGRRYATMAERLVELYQLDSRKFMH